MRARGEEGRRPDRDQKATRAKRAERATGSYQIGVLSKRTGVHIETIRYYERIGLMPAPPRTTGGHRVYDETMARRLAFIARMRELDFALGEVRVFLELADGGRYTCAEVRDLTLAQRERVRAKIADLTAMERVLGQMAAACHGGEVPDCPIIDALGRLV